MPASSVVTGAFLALAVLVAATVFGLWWRARQGRLATAVPAAPPASLAGLGIRPGAVTLLEFSSRICAPCRATSRLLADIAASHPGIEHLELDVETHLSAVQALNVRRTPTLFVLDRDGQVVARASGLPARTDVESALQPLLTSA